MKLQITEVVASEIVNHRLEPVLTAIQQFKSASDQLKRVAQTPLEMIDTSFEALNAAQCAAEMYRQQVLDYATRCRGAVLPIGGPDQAAELFNRYFAEAAPFAKRKEKKTEFPDAMSLLLLERYAKEYRTRGIIASKDAGWTAFAEASDYLFAVESIEELAALFAATTEHAQALKAKVLEAVRNEGSSLRVLLNEALEEHAAQSQWDAEDVYSGSHRIETEVSEINVTSYTIDENSINVWQLEDDPSTWSVEIEVAISVKVGVSVEFFVWDSIDREELSLGFDSYNVEEVISVAAYLSCTGVRLDNDPQTWHFETDISPASYSITGFEAEPDFSDWDE